MADVLIPLRPLFPIPNSPFDTPHCRDSYRSEILYEDNHLLAIAKPVELPTMGVPADRASLLELARQYIKQAAIRSPAMFTWGP